MADLVAVRALGVAVGIDAPADLVPEVRRAWSRALVDSEPEVVVTVDTVYDGAMSQLSSAVTMAAVERQAGSLWMLHAAGLAHPTSGATVALVAATGTGKTTAARLLGRRLGYVTDETVGVTLDGRVLPYAKPLSAIVDGVYPKRQLSPDELGLLVAPPDLRLRAVVVLRRDRTSPAGLTDVRPAAALPLIAEHTSYLTRLDRPLQTLAAILGGVPVHEAHYADAGDLEPLVVGLVGEP